MQTFSPFSDMPEYAFPRLRKLLSNIKSVTDPIDMSIGEPKHPYPKFIEEIKIKYKLSNKNIILSGFSQGCMMSINTGVTSDEEFNCIVGFSGKIINKDNLQKRIKNKSKILLIHGDQDEIVSSNFLLEAKDFFERNKFDIQTNLINNCGHHIPIEASSLALSFIKKNLNFK